MILGLYACSSTRKVPDGEFLLTENTFSFEGEKAHADEVADFVSQKPNKKQLFVLPLGLALYNAANPKYDSILTEYGTYPNEMRNQNLRDSLFIKYGKPQYVGKSLMASRFLHNVGQPPVILDHGKTENSANSIRKFLVYRGYWDAETSFSEKLDSSAKKATVEYKIKAADPTYINGYYYDIPDPSAKDIFEHNLAKSTIKNKEVLDQKKLEAEVKRITEDMRAQGFYKFNESNQEIYFTADTLRSRKQVPLTLEIKRDSANTPYKRSVIDSINVYVLNRPENIDQIKKVDTTLLKINFFERNKDYKTLAIWRSIISRQGDFYNQNTLDQTKRNLYSMNNFNISEEIRQKPGNDSIIDLRYTLIPLSKYDFKISTDLNYSQIMNFGVSPSVDLTTRNLFGGAENLITSVSGTFGSVQNPKNPDKRIIAYEVSAQASLNFPRLLSPIQYYKFLPKRYSPTSSIVIGASIQDNIGMGRIGFNAGLNYQATVNDIVSHRLTLFNTQFSLTRNKERYYDYFTGERVVVDEIHDDYFQVNPQVQAMYQNGELSYDGVSTAILDDASFVANYTSQNRENLDLYNSFLQSLTNKDRQTQDVLISSLIYNFVYNELGKKDRRNPVYLNAKMEFAGNLLSLFAKNEKTEGLVENSSKKLFGIPYSQFVKFDVDMRKYFTFFNDKHTLALRQLIGVGIPYGNSASMPFIRSYFNGGSNDIRAWRVYGGLGPADVDVDEKVRAYIMTNVKLTTNVEYRMPFNDMFEGAAFVDAGNIWSLKDSGLGDQFKFKKFISQMGVGTGVGLRINIAYITLRLDAAYKVYDPNKPVSERWVIQKFQPLKPVLNFAFGYPF